jgi:hypothetical protein
MFRPVIAINHPQDLALRAVGRNVLNFQRLEGCLKRLAKLQPIDGTLPQISRKLKTRTDQLSKSTLGSAIAGWLNVLDHTSGAPEFHEDLFHITARFTFTLKLSDHEKDRHADALASLLVERNALIHEGLLSIDWTSPEQCQELAARLDAQNKRIEKEIEFLLPFLRAFREAANELDDTFWAELRSEMQRRVAKGA